MNWLTDWVKPKISGWGAKKKDIPDDLWHKCTNCEQMIFHKELQKNVFVCPHCDHHMRLSAKARVDMLADQDDWTVLDIDTSDILNDPLKFRDLKRYSDRRKAIYDPKRGYDDALLCAHISLMGHDVVVAVMDFSVLGGSMGVHVGEYFLQAVRYAAEHKKPFLVVSSSGGARMQEGLFSLMQMPKTVMATSLLQQAGVPYIIIYADPTTGGVSASFASLADIVIAEQGAIIGFAGKRVIEQTLREKLPDDFQTAETLQKNGFVDHITHRRDLKACLGNLLSLIAP
jgi:acetyl-CoA carboxylase carboxyl transferase subunit beta